MLVCMRTTLNLADALVSAAKERASSTGATLTSVVEEGLRLVLAQQETASPPTLELPTFGIEGESLLVDLADRDALWTALDADPAR